MNASEEKEPSLADFELSIKHRIAQRTAGRIHALAVSVDADRIEIRGRPGCKGSCEGRCQVAKENRLSVRADARIGASHGRLLT
jgi:hypothetical protein